MLDACEPDCGVSLPEAVRMLTLSPAEAVGLDARKGSLSAGKDADFVLLDCDLNVRRVYLRGERMV